jgi:hypothetical protein
VNCITPAAWDSQLPFDQGERIQTTRRVTAAAQIHAVLPLYGGCSVEGVESPCNLNLEAGGGECGQAWKIIGGKSVRSPFRREKRTLETGDYIYERTVLA